MHSPRLRFCFLFGMGIVWVFSSSTGKGARSPEQDSEPELVRVYSTLSDSRIGTLVSEDEGQVTIKALDSRTNVTIKKTADLKIVKPLSLNDAARYAGLATVCGWKIEQMASQEKPIGKIANLAPQTVYITLGEESQLRVGQSVNVFREANQIVDPDTGEVLGAERSKIAQMEVVEVQPKFCKAKLVGDLEVELKVGDLVEPAKHGMVVAVCPLLNEDGTLTTVGAGIAEDLTTIMVQKKVSVVERSVMGMVLAELLAQNTTLFDEASAQKIGKLTGANVVLTGKIVPNKNAGRAYVRLISVETGKILFAVSAPVNLTSARILNSGNTEIRGVSPIANSDGTRYSKLSGRQLPSFLTTRAQIERVPNEGLRIAKSDTRIDRTVYSIESKDSDFLEHDFTFAIRFAFVPGDGDAAIFGLGMGQPDNESIFLKFHPLDERPWAGLVQVDQRDIGKVRVDGTHTVWIIKEGAAVTFHVDPSSDGPSDDDLETTIPDIRRHKNSFNSKNVRIFFAGAGIFKELSLVKGKASYPMTQTAEAPSTGAMNRADSAAGSISKGIAGLSKNGNSPEAGPSDTTPGKSTDNHSERETLKKGIGGTVWKSGNLQVSFTPDGGTGHFLKGGRWEMNSANSVKIYYNKKAYRLTLVFSNNFQSAKGYWANAPETGIDFIRRK